ncbi:dipeptide/tripeptide permease [Ancylomarina subtilis]|uniref:Dipeptide/tripeptide permease n=1 Tax=Ancylomarina subtilis TaxID=1639035 RepID=A0A4Q7VJB5_9BACT|nr:MFS transporter [Ancylomarina subtilis]RZT96280.1 dipeptide/tripeptide permease [Ancylomarina subtilis]
MSIEKKSTIKERFSRAFWVANSVELLERAAYYGVFIVITIYLSRILGFTDVEAAMISGLFSGGLYLLPTFSGALADKMGFKSALLLAFSLLTVGYAGLAIFPTMLESAGLVEYTKITTFTGLESSLHKWFIIPIIILIMIGGSFIKSVITGTVAKETTVANRAKGFSIFYTMVNIGAFSGKTIVKPLREAMGNEGLITLNYFSAGATLLGLIAVYFFFKTTRHEGEGKTIREIWDALLKVLANGRLVALILIVTGFWMVQHQLYATMPKYVLRMAGEGASPSWYANVNPLIVFLFVGLITQMMRKKTALFSMTVGMFIMPVSALCMAAGNLLDVESIVSMHPVAFMMIIGIVFQGFAESFISPRFLEYFSLQAPKGEEGMYLGFSHLHSFISSILGFGLSGYLLSRYCPDPKLFESHAAWEQASVHAHYIWYYFVAIAATSAIALIIFGRVTRKLDAKQALEEA